MSDVIYISELD